MSKQRLTYINGKAHWVDVEPGIQTTKTREMNAQGEDLTVDGYISKHGGIESSLDGKIYTSKSSYMDHIKANGCEIKDW